MVDFVLDLIDLNEGVDYAVVTQIIIGYLVLLWIFVSIWVFNDAKQRFGKVWIAVLLGVMNLILSFPFLLIYLLIRPSHKDDWEEFGEEGGINIPVVNFSGEDGVVISLQLKINSDKLSDKDTEYKLDVSLNTENDDDEPEVFPVIEKVENDNQVQDKPSRVKLIIGKISKVFDKLAEKKASFVDNIGEMTLTEVVGDEEIEEEQIENGKSKKKKKKKNKHKKSKK